MRRFVVLAFLYLAQGLPFGFFAHAVPVLLNRTHPAELVGLSGILAVPWGFKFLFGPFVDRVTRRRSVIVPVNAACVVSLFVLGLARPSPDHLAPLLAGFFIVSVFSAMQDVATDALALDVLRPDERGTGGAVQVAAQRVGIIAGGGGVLGIIDFIGYREAFWLMAIAIAAFTVPVFGIREAPRAVQPRGSADSASPGLLRTFITHPGSKAILGLLVCFKLGDALAAGMVTRWFVKQGLSNADIAWTRGFIGGVAAIVGALAGGALFRLAGHKVALVTVGALQTLAIFLYVGLDVLHPVGAGLGPMRLDVYSAASVVEHALGGAATAALFARMMDLCRDEARATDYTVQACVLVLVTGAGILTSGFIVGAIGLRGLFLVASVVGLLAPLGVLRFDRHRSPATKRGA